MENKKILRFVQNSEYVRGKLDKYDYIKYHHQQPSHIQEKIQLYIGDDESYAISHLSEQNSEPADNDFQHIISEIVDRVFIINKEIEGFAVEKLSRVETEIIKEICREKGLEFQYAIILPD